MKFYWACRITFEEKKIKTADEYKWLKTILRVIRKGNN
jgi:hypothetical protein